MGKTRKGNKRKTSPEDPCQTSSKKKRPDTNSLDLIPTDNIAIEYENEFEIKQEPASPDPNLGELVDLEELGLTCEVPNDQSQVKDENTFVFEIKPDEFYTDSGIGSFDTLDVKEEEYGDQQYYVPYSELFPMQDYQSEFFENAGECESAESNGPRIVTLTEILHAEAQKIMQLKAYPKISEKYMDIIANVPVVKIEPVKLEVEDMPAYLYAGPPVKDEGDSRIEPLVLVKKEEADGRWVVKDPDQLDESSQEMLSVRRSRRRVKRTNWKEIFQDKTGESFEDEEEDSSNEFTVHSKHARQTSSRHSNPLRVRNIRKEVIVEKKDESEPQPKKKRKPRKIRSYTSRRRIDWGLATELLKAAQAKDMDRFYEKAREIEEKCRRQAMGLDVEEEKETSDPLTTVALKTESGSDDEDLLQNEPFEKRRRRRRYSSSSSDDSCNNFIDLIRQRELRRVEGEQEKELGLPRHNIQWQISNCLPIFSGKLGEFEHQCQAPHMCTFCPTNDHDYDVPTRSVKPFGNVPPCIHVFDCGHFEAKINTPSLLELLAEEVKEKYSVGIVNPTDVQKVEHDPSEQDSEIDIMGDDDDDDDNLLPQMELGVNLECDEILAPSPVKSPCKPSGTKILSAEIDARKAQIRKVLQLPDTAKVEDHITFPAENDLLAKYSKYSRKRREDRVYWTTHACEIVVASDDTWYYPPRHLGMFNDSDCINTALGSNPVKNTELYDVGNGQYIHVQFSEDQVDGQAVNKKSCLVNDNVIKVRVKLISNYCLLVQQVKQTEGMEVVEKQDVIQIGPNGSIDNRQFHSLAGEYTGSSGTNTVLGDFIAKQAMQLVRRGKQNNQHQQLDMCFPHPAQLTPVHIKMKHSRRPPIMRKDTASIQSWPRRIIDLHGDYRRTKVLNPEDLGPVEIPDVITTTPEIRVGTVNPNDNMISICPPRRGRPPGPFYKGKKFPTVYEPVVVPKVNPARLIKLPEVNQSGSNRLLNDNLSESAKQVPKFSLSSNSVLTSAKSLLDNRTYSLGNNMAKVTFDHSGVVPKTQVFDLTQARPNSLASTSYGAAPSTSVSLQKNRPSNGLQYGEKQPNVMHLKVAKDNLNVVKVKFVPKNKETAEQKKVPYIVGKPISWTSSTNQRVSNAIGIPQIINADGRMFPLYQRPATGNIGQSAITVKATQLKFKIRMELIIHQPWMKSPIYSLFRAIELASLLEWFFRCADVLVD